MASEHFRLGALRDDMARASDYLLNSFVRGTSTVARGMQACLIDADPLRDRSNGSKSSAVFLSQGSPWDSDFKGRR